MGGWVEIVKAVAETPHSKKITALSGRDWVEVLPWSLHSMADAPDFDAEEKIGHSGRDDNARNKRNARAQPGIIPQ